MGKYSDIIEAAYAFIDVENNAQSIKEYYSKPKVSLDELAESIGVIIVDGVDSDEAFVSDINGKVHIKPNMPLVSDYDKAIVIGSYILYGKTPLELTEDESRDVSVFGLSVVAPGIKDHTDREPTMGDMIKLSRKLSVPFAAIKEIFN